MKKTLYAIMLFGLFTFSGCDRISSIQKYDIKSLESQAEEIDTMFNVSARKYVDTYFQLSDAYYFGKDYQKSYGAAIKGLRLDSQNILYQCRAAELEIYNKDYTSSYQRIQYILNITDDEKIVKKCDRLLKLILQDKIDVNDIVVAPMFAKKLIVCIFPEVNELLGKAIIDRIRQEYKLGIIEIHTGERENTIHTRADQYDANVLIEQANHIAAPLVTADVIGVLAITDKDIYSGEDTNNFLFGLADATTAVMSLKRFETFQTPNSVIMKRAVMQAFASTGHVLGIPRCTAKACARAYANSLGEQDRKNDKLCFECIQNINGVYATW